MNKRRLSPVKIEKERNIKFVKRKLGLLKKASEMAIECDTKIYLMLTDNLNNLYRFVYPRNENVLEHFDNIPEFT